MHVRHYSVMLTLSLSAALMWTAIAPTRASDTRMAEVAEQKAEVLEQKASAEPSEAPTVPVQALTPTGVQAVDPQGNAPLDDPITCLSRSIYWEARGAGTAEMEAVANVVMNRLGHPGFPNTVCEVVRQGSEQGNCQFSWWCDGRSDIAHEEQAYAESKEIARRALNGSLADATDGALFFHHKQVSPSWSDEYIKTAETNEFDFYRPDDS
ncbi:cell wall hydrolase [Halomonas sp. HP20-15]|uniref:cell wall hydrolase n=1 Tax=Halomonas sp. HP20-15 TaxID=3085901 RepID=UPI0029825D41|nr:cell wall hydrolase [Halomonas sp. HP20-15]MDW5377694.1 cell wall hydrolase [Halomonas sp. HP20-15]